MANQGGIDGELFRGNINRDEFPNLLCIPVPILNIEIVVFTKDVEFEVTGWDSLQPYTIGFQVGMKRIETGTKGMQVESVTTTEQLFMKLAAGRNDIVVLPRDLGMDVLKSMMVLGSDVINLNTLQGIKVLEPPLYRDFLYHHLHSKHAELVPKITAALQEMADEKLIRHITEEVEAEFLE